MTKSTLDILAQYEQLRRKASMLDFYVNVDRHGIELRPGLMKAMPDREKSSMVFNSVEEVECFLNGVEWQVGYAKQLGFDQNAAERTWREERDRERILITLSKE